MTTLHTSDSHRSLGLIGAVAGVAWSVLVVWEFQAGLETGPLTGARLVNEIAFTLAMGGYVAMLVGLHRARPGGSGLGARIATGVLATAWMLLLAGQLISLLTDIDQDANPFLPLGGLLQGIGAIAAGIAVVRHGVWSGWRRWWPLVTGVYYVLVLMGPAFAGDDPSMITESIWALTYAVLGVALATGTHGAGVRGIGVHPRSGPRSARDGIR